jgi:hypothetical protein
MLAMSQCISVYIGVSLHDSKLRVPVHAYAWVWADGAFTVRGNMKHQHRVDSIDHIDQRAAGKT